MQKEEIEHLPKKRLKIAIKRPLKILLFIGALVLLWNVPKQLFQFIEKPLEYDKNGHTNILLLGVGGYGHEGPDLTDTIMVASINLWDPFVSFLSIPRDIYINTKEFSGIRLNAMYEIAKKHGTKKALELGRKTIANLFDIPIHYVVKVDFEAFKKVIDSVGGIKIALDEHFSDPFYPKDGTEQYDPIFLAKGTHTLDGDMALKFARSRKTSSDFDRSKRQQKILQALQEKTLSLRILATPRRIAQVFDIIQSHVETDLSLRRILALSEIGTKLAGNAFHSAVLNDDPGFEGGFLYVPPRTDYGGAFVLLPQRDSWDESRLYTRMVLYDAKTHKEKTQLQVLNGTKNLGLAASVKAHLRRFGFSVIRFGNAQTGGVAKTTIYYKDEKEPEIIRLLRPLFPEADVSANIPAKYLEPAYSSDAKIIIELGQDFAAKYTQLESYYESIYVPQNTPSPVSVEN